MADENEVIARVVSSMLRHTAPPRKNQCGTGSEASSRRNLLLLLLLLSASLSDWSLHHHMLISAAFDRATQVFLECDLEAVPLLLA